MNSRVLGVLGRLAGVLGLIGAIHLAARYIQHQINGHDGWSYEEWCYGLGPGEECVPGKVLWFEVYEPDNGVEWFFSHFFGLLLVVAVWLVLAGILWVVRYILFGHKPYVDPCTNPACPCARHEVERRNRQTAQTAAIAGVTAAIISSTVSSGS